MVAGGRRRTARAAPHCGSFPFKEISLFSFLSLSLVAGYALVGTGSSALPRPLRRLYVPTFVNDTTVVGLDSASRTPSSESYPSAGGSARGRPPAADAERSGRLTGCSVSPVRFDANGIAVESR